MIKTLHIYISRIGKQFTFPYTVKSVDTIQVTQQDHRKSLVKQFNLYRDIHMS